MASLSLSLSLIIIFLYHKLKFQCQLLRLSPRQSSFVSVRPVVDVCSDVSEELAGFIFRLVSSGLRGCCTGWKHERVGCMSKLEKIWLIRTVEG
jgi:hypothetical protein